MVARDIECWTSCLEKQLVNNSVSLSVGKFPYPFMLVLSTSASPHQFQTRYLTADSMVLVLTLSKFVIHY